MISRTARTVFGSLIALGMMAATIAPAAAQFWQCAPYARAISGIEIYGNAHTWWAQASEKYARGSTPAEGAVLAFKSHGKMRLGHVAMVSRVVSDREILLTHANWSYGGKIERNVRAVDVSAAGDWSKVRVWHAQSGDIGLTEFPAYGFIYKDAAQPEKHITLAQNRLGEIAGLIESLRL